MQAIACCTPLIKATLQADWVTSPYISLRRAHANEVTLMCQRRFVMHSVPYEGVFHTGGNFPQSSGEITVFSYLLLFWQQSVTLLSTVLVKTQRTLIPCEAEVKQSFHTGEWVCNVFPSVFNTDILTDDRSQRMNTDAVSRCNVTHRSHPPTPGRPPSSRSFSSASASLLSPLSLWSCASLSQRKGCWALCIS